MEQCIALVNITKDFQNLRDGPHSAIEFRRCPGATVSPADALAWAELAIAFIGAVIKAAGSYENLHMYMINVGGLNEFLQNGVAIGVGDDHGRAKDLAQTDGVTPISLDKDAKRVNGRKEKDMFVRKMEKMRQAALANIEVPQGRGASGSVRSKIWPGNIFYSMNSYLLYWSRNSPKCTLNALSS